MLGYEMDLGAIFDPLGHCVQFGGFVRFTSISRLAMRRAVRLKKIA